MTEAQHASGPAATQPAVQPAAQPASPSAAQPATQTQVSRLARASDARALAAARSPAMMGISGGSVDRGRESVYDEGEAMEEGPEGRNTLSTDYFYIAEVRGCVKELVEG